MEQKKSVASCRCAEAGSSKEELLEAKLLARQKPDKGSLGRGCGNRSPRRVFGGDLEFGALGPKTAAILGLQWTEAGESGPSVPLYATTYRGYKVFTRGAA